MSISRKIAGLCICMILQMHAFSQNSFTVGNIYDFEIGDIFQYGASYSSDAPPSGRQKEVIDKYYSINSDTLFYVFEKIYYSSDVDWSSNPPQLVYSFSVSYDTSLHTNLNSGVHHTFHGTPTEITYKVDLCNDSVINYRFVYNPDFEPEIYVYEYALGLGQISSEHSYSAENFYSSSYLKYYNKGGIACGDYDNTYEMQEIHEPKQKNTFSIYPNPANDNVQCVINNLQLRDFDNYQKTKQSIEIYNLTGKLLKEIVIASEAQQSQAINISDLQKGIYLIKMGAQTQVLIIE